MFIELVDALRCPVSHEESWLVASATQTDARHIVDGLLGCPVCQAEYPIRQGVADFRRATQGEMRAAGEASPSSEDERTRVEGLQQGECVAPHVRMPPRRAADPALAMRLAAFLGLADASGFAVLVGAWGAQAPALRELVETPLLLVDPPTDVQGEPGISVIRTDGDIPLAAGSARGVAIDRVPPARLASAIRVARAGARIVAPAGLVRPDEVRELARDAELWVGEKESGRSGLVTLHVRRG